MQVPIYRDIGTHRTGPLLVTDCNWLSDTMNATAQEIHLLTNGRVYAECACLPRDLVSRGPLQLRQHRPTQPLMTFFSQGPLL